MFQSKKFNFSVMELNIFTKPIKYLKKTGVWIDREAPKNRVRLLIASHVLFVDLMMVFTTIFLFTTDDFVVFCESMFITSFYVGVWIKSLNIMYNEKKIESLMTSLKALVEDKDLIGLKNGLKLKERVCQVDRVFKINLSPMIITCIFNYVITFVLQRLPLKMWAPWIHENNGIIFWVTALYQLVDISIVAPAMLIMDTLPIFFMAYATALIEELICCLENVTVEEPKKKEKKINNDESGLSHGRTMINVQPFAPREDEPGPSHGRTTIKVQPFAPREDGPLKTLQKLIPVHVKIKIFLTNIQDVFGTVFFLQEFMSISILCTTAFYLTQVNIYYQHSDSILYVLN
jgi:hypothetical protein